MTTMDGKISIDFDGNRHALTFVGTEDTGGFPKYFKLKDVERLEHSGVILRYGKA